MIHKLFIITLAFLIIHYQPVSGQGCSDAGACTIHGVKPETGDDIQLTFNQIKAGLFVGKADYDILVWGNYIEYNRQVSDNFGFDIKFTALAQNGNDLSVFGPGDLFLTGNYTTEGGIRIIGGAKLPLANGNKMKDNLPLPMDYQSSLGTVDLIFGFGFNIENFLFGFALQQPLTQNKNEFNAGLYPVNSPLVSFQSTYKYKRGGDALMRVSYPVKLANGISLTASLLPIYHLLNDKYTDASGKEQEINGSKGITLNGNVFLDYDISEMYALQISAGMPFIVRDTRPDGLTRGFIANVEYRIKF